MNNSDAFPTEGHTQPENPGYGGFAPMQQQPNYGVPAEAQELGYVNVAYLQQQAASAVPSGQTPAPQGQPRQWPQPQMQAQQPLQQPQAWPQSHPLPQQQPRAQMQQPWPNQAQPQRPQAWPQPQPMQQQAPVPSGHPMQQPVMSPAGQPMQQPFLQGPQGPSQSFASPMVLLESEDRNEEEELEEVLEDGSVAKRKPRKGPWTVVFFVALAVFLASMGALAYIFYTYQAGEQSYDELDHFVTLPVSQDKSDEDLFSFDIDWEGLRAINPDVVGWVYLPGTIINYPVVYQADGGQEFYMTHNFQRHSFEGFGAEYGCPVLADVNSPEWNDQISFIAGHHMWNDTMFSFLESMVDSGVFNENRTFYLLTPKGNFRLTAIACDRISQYSKETVIPNFGTTKEFREYMQNAYDASLVEPDPPAPSVNSLRQIVALYTCSNVNDTFRIMIYCNVDQFLPAGSKVPKENALFDESTADDISSSVEERVQ